MAVPTSQQRPAITFVYLGRRGALGQFTRELMQAAARVPEQSFDFIFSADNDIADALEGGGNQVLSIPTFSGLSPTSALGNYRVGRHRILEWLRKRTPRAVVTLMPHVWTPLLAPAIRRLGIKYVPVIHDARAHPGDPTAWVTRWLRQDARHGDLVVTLSRAVAERLTEHKLAPQEKILPLFHPDLAFQSSGHRRRRDPTAPLRLLFFGRIMAYKGLSHFVRAAETLRGEGAGIELGLAGSGDMGAHRDSLERLGAEVTNRWIAENEVTSILDRYDAVACPHVEASQSGVVAAAFGHRLPVVAMPIGGIAEQVIDGETGVLARRVTSEAFADAVRRLAQDPLLYDAISEHLTSHASERSMDRFLWEILDETA